MKNKSIGKVQSKRSKKETNQEKRNNQYNKQYMILYLILIGILISNIIQTGLALSTGMFVEFNPIGYNWVLFLGQFLFCLLMSIPFFIKTERYEWVFLMGIITAVFVGFYCFIHDLIVICGG